MRIDATLLLAIFTFAFVAITAVCFTLFSQLRASTKEEGVAAIEKFNGQKLGGRFLKVDEAKQA